MDVAQTSTRGRPYRRLVEWTRQNLPWVCWICWAPITAVAWPDPRSWSLDHAIPVSRGGPRLSRDNARPAHLGCNSSKGARPVSQARRALPVPPPSRDW